MTIVISHTGTIAPDGKPFAMTHRDRKSGRLWRILLGPVPNVSDLGRSSYVLADERGLCISMSEATFLDRFEYVPGGQ